jgi:hypothetical protein
MGRTEKQIYSCLFTDTFGKRLIEPAGSAYRFRADRYGQSYWSGSENTCGLPECTAQTVTIQAPQDQPADKEITDNFAGNHLEMAAVDEVVNPYTCDAACAASPLPGGASIFWMTGCNSANLLRLFAESIVADNQEFKKLLLRITGKKETTLYPAPEIPEKSVSAEA